MSAIESNRNKSRNTKIQNSQEKVLTPSAAGYQKYTSPLGFSFDIPEGWSVESSKQSGLLFRPTTELSSEANNLAETFITVSKVMNADSPLLAAEKYTKGLQKSAPTLQLVRNFDYVAQGVPNHPSPEIVVAEYKRTNDHRSEVGLLAFQRHGVSYICYRLSCLAKDREAYMSHFQHLIKSIKNIK